MNNHSLYIAWTQEQVARCILQYNSAKAPVILICTSCSKRFKSNYEAQKHYMETNHHYFKLKGTTKVLSVG